jgi:molecular chaperone DnaK
MLCALHLHSVRVTAATCRRDAVAEDDTEKIKAASEALQKEVMDMGAAMYQAAGAAGGAPGPDAGAAPGGSGAAPGGGDDNVIDAEFTDKK